MFAALLRDPYIDPSAPDSDFMKPRRGTVIFSAFHKMLYSREKILIKKRFEQDLQTEYVDYQAVNSIQDQKESYKSVSRTNKVRCDHESL